MALFLGVGLSGCGGGETVQQALGYEQKGPDEMAVIKRPPLIVPPDYNLRPPRLDDPKVAGNAASDAARQTLVGSPSPARNGEAQPLASLPSSEDKSPPAIPDDARAILTGGAPERDVADEQAEAPSEGQNLLVSRTNRVERDLDSLTESRAENRVDSALLRRLLVWSPKEPTETAEDDETSQTASLVQVIKREQTPIDAQPDAE